MVFHGRPSRDCAPCRSRKTRCDLVPTGCSQCRRAKVTCYGYRNSNELVFRDETRKTVQKAAALQRATQLPSTPQWTPDTSARHAFLSLYMGTYSRCFPTPVQALLTESDPDGHLQLCVDAVGFAFMAFQLNRQDLIPHAYRSYLRAIKRLGTVVGSSSQATNGTAIQPLSDGTVQSILLLDLYEKMSCQYYQMPAHPGLPLSHIQAALSILQTCPRREFSNPIMQQLASRTAFGLTLSCGATETPIPEALIRLYNDLNSYMSGPLWILVGLTMRLVDFHAAASAGKFSLSYILEHARDFREELSQAQSNIPRSWWPRRIDTNDTLAFGGYYNVYARHEVCQILNSYRVLRLGVCAILLKFPNSSGVTEELAQVTQEICATVPQFVLPQARPQNTFPLSPLQILECSGLLTPLYAAAQNTQDPVMHAWILRTVIYMADNGVKGARTVADIMTSSPDLHQWKVCSMVGNYAVFA